MKVDEGSLMTSFIISTPRNSIVPDAVESTVLPFSLSIEEIKTTHPTYNLENDKISYSLCVNEKERHIDYKF